MASAKSSAETITGRLRGLQFLAVALDGRNRLEAHFEGGTVLVVTATSDGLSVKVEAPTDLAAALPRPTRRQHEYLAFIGKYIARYGRAPAESDIERHFLVSAPSVNQMMQSLERHGFITRQKGVPRSARLRSDLADLYVRAKN
jgi:repressor LexA